MPSTSFVMQAFQKKNHVTELSLFDFPPLSLQQTANRYLDKNALQQLSQIYVHLPPSLIYCVICISSEDTALAAVVAK